MKSEDLLLARGQSLAKQCASPQTQLFAARTLFACFKICGGDAVLSRHGSHMRFDYFVQNGTAFVLQVSDIFEDILHMNRLSDLQPSEGAAHLIHSKQLVAFAGFVKTEMHSDSMILML